MTKLVRIENGDTSDHRLLVELWNIDENGNHFIVEKRHLNFPTDLTTMYLHGKLYVKITEDGQSGYTLTKTL